MPDDELHVVRALASLALDLLDTAAFELLTMLAVSPARLSSAGLACVRERAAQTRLAAAQVAVSCVRRARHVGLSNCVVRDEGAKCSTFSPERLAFGLDQRDMAALCRLIHGLDAVQDAALEASTQPDAARLITDALLAHALPQAGSDAALASTPGAVPRARAAVRAAAAAAVLGAERERELSGEPHPSMTSMTVGQRVLLALRENLPMAQRGTTTRELAVPHLAASPPAPAPAQCTAAPRVVHATAADAQLLPPRPPGFVPFSPPDRRDAAVISPVAVHAHVPSRPGGAGALAKRARPAGGAGASAPPPARAALLSVTARDANAGGGTARGSILAFFPKRKRPSCQCE
ncbi:hypothetical protein KFE25_006760 [Diacronema lutheri]|uniref:Uncharacterized protein n=1 Tax=Diacronema lutheri TaxID=2081491 RepID=A0A8J6CHF7_DIALT|nr:hypothetical protein KFE25_006760 [Diacronema lutheri]